MITKAMRLAVLATVLFTLVACSSTGTSVPKPTQLQAITSQLQLVKHWSVAVGAGDSDGHSVRQPVIAEEQIIAVAAQGNVAAYTLDKGVINWQVDLAEPISAGVGQAGKLLLLATQSGKLLALDSVDGTLVWQAKTSSEVLTVPQANASIVVVQTIDGKVSAHQVSDGQFLWSYTANLPSLTVRGTSTPVVTENFTYAGFASGRLVALDNQSGKLIWQQSISAAKGRSEIERLVDIDGALKLVDNTLYVTSYQGALSAVDAFTGAVKWQQPLSSLTSVQLIHGVILVVDADDNVLAYDASLGHVLWQNNALKYRLLGSPMGLGGHAMVIDAQGYAHLLQLSDGAFLGRQKIGTQGARIGSQRYQNNIYILSQDGRLMRLGLK